jgi:hypothetical protein
MFQTKMESILFSKCGIIASAVLKQVATHCCECRGEVSFNQLFRRSRTKPEPHVNLSADSTLYAILSKSKMSNDKMSKSKLPT